METYIKLNDFAIHEPVADFLFLLQAQNTALADAKKLTEKLSSQRAEIRKALEKEKELSELKSRFITTTSHEFRTPLAVILIWWKRYNLPLATTQLPFAVRIIARLLAWTKNCCGIS